MSEGDQLTSLKTLISLLQSKVVSLESGRIDDDQLEDFAENFIPLQYRKLCYDLKCTFPSLRKLSEVGSVILPPATIPPLGVRATDDISVPVKADISLIEDKVGPVAAAVTMNMSVGTNPSTTAASIQTTSTSTINKPVTNIAAGVTDNANAEILATGNATAASKTSSFSTANITTNVSSASSVSTSIPAQVGRKRKMSQEISDGDNKNAKPLESTPLSTTNSRKNSIIKDNNKDNPQLSSSSPGKISSRKLRGSSIDDEVSLHPSGSISGKKIKGIFSFFRFFYIRVLCMYVSM
jgi:hypothetical protein